MEDMRKTKAQLVEELTLLRQRVAELESGCRAGEDLPWPLQPGVSQALDALSDGVTVMDMDGVVKYANARALDILGLSSVEELVGRQGFDFLAKRDRARARADITGLLAGGTLVKVEYDLLRADGTEFAGEVSSSVVRDRSGRPEGFVAATRDVEDRKRDERGMRRWMDIERMVLDVSTRIISMSDADDAIRASLADIGSYTGADRAYVLALREDRRTLGSRHQWCADGVMREARDPQGVDPALKPLCDSILGGVELTTVNVVDLPPASAQRRVLEERGLRSLLMLPLSVGGRLAGCIVFENIGDLSKCIGDAAVLLKVYAATIGHALERLRTQEEMQRREAQFRALIENSSDGIATVDKDGVVLYESPSVERILLYQPAEVVGRSMLELIHPDDREEASKVFRKLVANPEEFATTVMRVPRKDGSWSVVDVGVKNLLNDDAVRGLVINYRDVTRQREAEEELRESEAKYAAAVEHAADGVMILQDGLCQFMNPAAEEITGYSSCELVGRSIADIMAPEHREVAVERYRSWMEGDGVPAPIEVEIRCSNGSVKYVEGRLGAIQVQGRPALVAVIRDTTERRRAEDLLRESEERFRALIENASDAVVIVNSDGDILFESPSIGRLFGYAAGEVLGRNMMEFIHPDDVELALDYLREVLGSPGVPLAHELRILHKGGEWRTIETVTTNLLEDPRVRGVVSNYRDITELRRHQDALRDSEARYRLVAEHVSDFIWTLDTDLRLTFTSPSGTRMLGYGAAEMASRSVQEFMTPGSFDEVRRVAEVEWMVEEGGRGDPLRSRTLVLELCRKDGSIVWTENNVTFLRDGDGRPIGYLGVTRDMTERRLAEEALRESEAKYSAVVEQANDGIVIVQDGRCKFANRALAEISGFSMEEVLTMPVTDTLLSESRRLVVDRHRRRLAGEKVPSVYGIEVRCKDGSVKQLEVSYGSVEYEGRAAHLATVRDVTERNEMLYKLRQSEEATRLLVENSPDFIYIVDRDARIQYLNRAVKGLTPDQLTGATLYEYIEPQYEETYRTNLARVFELGETVAFRLEAIGPDHGVAWYESRLVPITDGGNVLNCMLIATDITERRLAEEARIQQAAAEARAEGLMLSRQRMMTVQESLRREIASRIHGSVQGKLIVQLHRLAELEKSATSPEVAAGLRQVQDALREVMDSHLRPMSRMLYPSILKQGLVPAMQSLTDSFESLLSLDLRLDQELVDREKTNRKFIPEDIRLAAWRVAEEALANAAKHAVDSRVTMTVGMLSDGSLSITLSDDGPGFDPSGVSAGVGIPMMRDYAEVAGGVFGIESSVGEGTAVRATFSLGDTAQRH